MAESSHEHLKKSKEASTLAEMFHEMRKSIDALIQWTKKLQQNDSSYGREISLVHTKLQEAKMWAGKCLEAIGSKLPEEFRDKAE
ncbi:hypothetical protein LCGC14_0641240 [marine sediment metagenome]|uniref:Acb2/Tad1 hairpin domain-containing protein n=1 Tax=marine sediment metagenome TaxID=412755 RepID=A0A0F9R446_9ZZZZ|nr:hypothetical protein [archaeon]